MKGEETWHASQTKTQSGTHNSEDDQRDEDCTPLEISLSSSWEEEKRRQKGSEKDTQNRIAWLPACRQSIAWGVEWATEWKCLEQSSQTRYEFISLGIIMYNKQTKRRKKSVWFLLVVSLSPWTISSKSYPMFAYLFRIAPAPTDHHTIPWADLWTQNNKHWPNRMTEF